MDPSMKEMAASDPILVVHDAFIAARNLPFVQRFPNDRTEPKNEPAAREGACD
jgi:hypothetical protein